MSQPHNSMEETKVKLYGAIDLHSSNNVPVVIDEQDRAIYHKRFPQRSGDDRRAAVGLSASPQSIVVESTYNWYWLVVGLMERGYEVRLANTAVIQQYEEIKYTDDHNDPPMSG